MPMKAYSLRQTMIEECVNAACLALGQKNMILDYLAMGPSTLGMVLGSIS